MSSCATRSGWSTSCCTLRLSSCSMTRSEWRTGTKPARSRALTPGEMLADNLRQCRKIIRDIRPDADIWVWSDMFDPMHNAHDDYYLVNGTWAGSWEGLSPDIGIVNWAGHLNGKNCRFFADHGEKQVLAGYYDGDEDGSGIAQWLKNAEGIPGIAGAMYTTWQDKYGAMEGLGAESLGRRRSGQVTSRERVTLALNHQEADRVPFDLGSAGTTGIMATTYAKVRRALGVNARAAQSVRRAPDARGGRTAGA